MDLSPNPNITFRTNIIFANLHRFEYDFGRVRAAVTGLGIFVRENNAFALADFFPVSSWHATQYRPFNLSLVFDLEAALFPGFRVMAQFGFDDVNASDLFGVGDAPIPTIPAAIVGCEYQRAPGPRRAGAVRGAGLHPLPVGQLRRRERRPSWPGPSTAFSWTTGPGSCL